MKDKIKFELSDSEKKIVFNALISLRNVLKEQERPTTSIDEILLSIGNNHKIELDIVDAKILINSLNNLRDKYIETNEPRKELNDILLKIIEETDKKKLILRIAKGNDRKK